MQDNIIVEIAVFNYTGLTSIVTKQRTLEQIKKAFFFNNSLIVTTSHKPFTITIVSTFHEKIEKEKEMQQHCGLQCLWTAKSKQCSCVYTFQFIIYTQDADERKQLVIQTAFEITRKSVVAKLIQNLINLKSLLGFPSFVYFSFLFTFPFCANDY